MGYTAFSNSFTCYECDEYYNGLMCLKPTTAGSRAPTPEDYAYVDGLERLDIPEKSNLSCVLPLGHSSECRSNLNSIFTDINEPFTKKLITSTSNAIFSTPGNDSFVFKNRASRLFGIALTLDEQRKIRNKDERKRCAIPLRDVSTPTLMAQAYLDWMTYVLSIRGIEEYIKVDSPLLPYMMKHKEYLMEYYTSLERKIFSPEGKTICVVTRRECTLEDFADCNRDIRMDVRDTDIQMGHNNPRNEQYASIRGKNLMPMSRRGNLIIGERVFTEDEWRKELLAILA
tara:strand:+ start:3500 stop:4357 length:858 start_codon:yes stop_codon:yes gene_type:complete